MIASSRATTSLDDGLSVGCACQQESIRWPSSELGCGAIGRQESKARGVVEQLQQLVTELNFLLPTGAIDDDVVDDVEDRDPPLLLVLLLRGDMGATLERQKTTLSNAINNIFDADVLIRP
jgi:hypothetical protein